jgi:hypothetical protein
MGYASWRAGGAFRAAEQLAVAKIPKIEPKFRSFTKRNYRENLIRLTGVNPEGAVDAHHVFPQKYRERFLKKGINIDEPRYLTWWEKESHRRAASAYNKAWDEFIRKNQTATSVQILQQGKEFMAELGGTSY